MIYLLSGENDFTKRERLTSLLAELGGAVERVDGSEMSPGELRDLAMSRTLFDESRVIVISDLSEGEAWQSVPDVLVGSEANIVLLEQRADKRTKTYKWLKKEAKVEEFLSFGDRDEVGVVGWVVDRAKSAHGLTLSRALAGLLVGRLGYNQSRLDNVMAQLSLADKVDEQMIEMVVPLPKTENVFELFESVMSGKREVVHQIINYLELESGPDGAYQTLGLVVSQLLPLSALVLGGSPDEVAKDLSVHPFVVQKLAPYARSLSARQISQMNQALARADSAMKSTTVSPWLLLEAALVEISIIAKS